MQRLQERIRRLFATDDVNIDEVERALCEYRSVDEDWAQYAMFDPLRYTRNLVDRGNGKYNLMILCWGPGMYSSIHDHSNSHCFVKILSGSLLETRYQWPEDDSIEAPMKILDQSAHKRDAVSYMSDELGLHRMENPSPTAGTVTLHLYIPGFDRCNIFDSKTGQHSACSVTLWSEFGRKLDEDAVRQRIMMVGTLADHLYEYVDLA